MRRAYWDDDVSVLSAENVFFEIETAGLAARFGATIIDLTLQLFAAALLGFGFALFESFIAPMQNWALWTVYLATALLILLLFIIFYAYYFFFEWLWDGQTPGKRLMKLRVMQADGMPITYWHALVRNILRIADFLPFFYGAGGLIALLSTDNRRIGDLVAGTIVAKERGDLGKEKVLDIHAAIENFLNAGAPAAPERRESTPAGAQNQSTPVATQAIQDISEVDETTAVLLARLDAQDYELVRDFQSRRETLPTAARARLAKSLSLRLAAKLQIDAPPEVEAEEFLGQVAERVQGRM
jgi:uncharacterized RDD family membrane protein YckC